MTAEGKMGGESQSDWRGEKKLNRCEEKWEKERRGEEMSGGERCDS